MNVDVKKKFFFNFKFVSLKIFICNKTYFAFLAFVLIVPKDFQASLPSSTE